MAKTARAQRDESVCAFAVRRDREDCVRARGDSAYAALDRTIGRIIESLPTADRRPFLQRNEQWHESQIHACRIVAMGPLYVTPATQAFTQCMVDASNRRVHELERSYPASGTALPNHGGCVAYEPDTVTLSGSLERRTYPGRPNYESVARGDEAETGFYLVVNPPLCVTRNLDEVNRPMAAVSVLQLVLDRRGYDRLRPSLGHGVTIRGALFHSYTGHHHAELLLYVAK